MIADFKVSAYNMKITSVVDFQPLGTFLVQGYWILQIWGRPNILWNLDLSLLSSGIISAIDERFSV
jgi:hypothetical protein